MDGPNPLRALMSMLRARRLRHPRPAGTDSVDHANLDPILARVAAAGVAGLEDGAADLAAYLAALESVDPDDLGLPEAKAYWLNLYNAGALDLARRTRQTEVATVLRVPGGFEDPFVTVAGEDLSLDGIEHGKVRRFKDPRIHGALVCGSASCPTLRSEAYRGADVEAQLEDQMSTFLAHGGVVIDRRSETVRPSRVFLWYGADFVRPHRMPTLLPSSKGAIRDRIAAWMPEEDRRWIEEARPKVEFQDYDWSLACSVR